MARKNVDHPSNHYIKNPSLIILLLPVIFIFIYSPQTNDTKWSSLSASQKAEVIRLYKLSRELYVNGYSSLALNNLDKLQKITPDYKDSETIREYSLQFLELAKKKPIFY